MPNETYAVVLAGGKGERFWPMSTARCPKQLLALVDDKPLVTLAVERLASWVSPERIFIVTHRSLVNATCRVVPFIPRGNVVGEPVGRDTAAAAALGTALVKARCPNGIVMVMTADHMIGNVPGFKRTLKAACAMARESDCIVTIGKKPVFPSTGFGYIQAGKRISRRHGVDLFAAKRFVEKPNEARARMYLRDGHYYWNLGMFVWSVPTFEDAVARHRPQLIALMRRVASADTRLRLNAGLKVEYAKLDKISVDYAIMEKAGNIRIASGAFEWDDVGSWPSLANHAPCDEKGNAVIGSGEFLDASGNIVVSRDGLVALIGVRDMVVVRHGHTVLVCPKSRAQDVKKMVEQLGRNPRYRKYV